MRPHLAAVALIRLWFFLPLSVGFLLPTRPFPEKCSSGLSADENDVKDNIWVLDSLVG